MATNEVISTDYSTGEGEIAAKPSPGIAHFVGEVRHMPPRVEWEWPGFADPELRRRWDALTPEQREQGLAIVKRKLQGQEAP